MFFDDENTGAGSEAQAPMTDDQHVADAPAADEGTPSEAPAGEDHAM